VCFSIAHVLLHFGLNCFSGHEVWQTRCKQCNMEVHLESLYMMLSLEEMPDQGL
jgi:hypothetical protein